MHITSHTITHHDKLKIYKFFIHKLIKDQKLKSLIYISIHTLYYGSPYCGQVHSVCFIHPLDEFRT